MAAPLYFEKVADNVAKSRQKISRLAYHLLASHATKLGAAEVGKMLHNFSRRKGQEKTLSPFESMLLSCDEVLLRKPWIYFSVGGGAGMGFYCRLHCDRLKLEKIDRYGYVSFKAR